MLKIVVQIEEKDENQVFVGIKQISKREFDKSTQNEKMTASQIKNAIEESVYALCIEEKGRGNNEKKRNKNK